MQQHKTRSELREEREKAKQEAMENHTCDDCQLDELPQDEEKHFWKRKKATRTRSASMAKERERNRFLNWAIVIVGILLIILFYFVFNV